MSVGDVVTLLAESILAGVGAYTLGRQIGRLLYPVLFKKGRLTMPHKDFILKTWRNNKTRVRYGLTLSFNPREMWIGLAFARRNAPASRYDQKAGVIEVVQHSHLMICPLPMCLISIIREAPVEGAPVVKMADIVNNLMAGYPPQMPPQSGGINVPGPRPGTSELN